MRKLKATVIYTVEIEVDDNDDIVSEYASDMELIEDCAKIGFTPIIPVIEQGGVKVIECDWTVEQIEPEV